jgi:hypothetical protein
MLCEYNIINKNSIHLNLDTNGANYFVEKLKILQEKHILEIVFEAPKVYIGKSLYGFRFLVKEEGEYVTFENNYLVFDIEDEMVEEFILFIKNAVLNNGFRTPEIIDFSGKSKKKENITIYGFLKNEP